LSKQSLNLLESFMSRWLNNGTESCHQIKVFHVTLRQNAKRWNKILDYCLHIMCKVWLCTNTESRKFDFVEFNIHTISIVIYRNTRERIPNISHAVECHNFVMLVDSLILNRIQKTSCAHFTIRLQKWICCYPVNWDVSFVVIE